MAISAEVALFIPILIPLIMGLLVGIIIRHTVKLMFPIIALILLLAATGYIGITSQDVFEKAMEYLPRIIGTGSGLIDVLPYSTTTFIIGLAIGLWKG